MFLNTACLHVSMIQVIKKNYETSSLLLFFLCNTHNMHVAACASAFTFAVPPSAVVHAPVQHWTGSYRQPENANDLRSSNKNVLRADTSHEERNRSLDRARMYVAVARKLKINTYANTRKKTTVSGIPMNGEFCTRIHRTLRFALRQRTCRFD